MIVGEKLYSPHELMAKIPKLGLRMQRNRRRDGSLPYLVIGSRVFYSESGIERFLSEAEQQVVNDEVEQDDGNDDA
jgi:hypothetical protein